MENNKRKAIRLGRFIATIVCLAVLIVSAVIIGSDYIEEKQQKEKNSSIMDLYYGLGLAAYAEEDIPELEPEQPREDVEVDTSESIDEDFIELYALNKHLVGVLKIGDVEELEQPIVKHDNEFYLSHDFTGEEYDGGCVFINELNELWPADKNILFHGHNMKSGAVFGKLDEYRKLDFLKEIPVISWRTIRDDEETFYVPIAIFDASMNSGAKGYFDIGHIWFDDDEAFLEFANSCIERSIFDMPVDVQAEDNLITLITCSYEYDNSRFIVVARALREDETVESVTELMQETTKK